jgi:alkylation response protein AidB-like acyl-CoA dehydrogenase
MILNEEQEMFRDTARRFSQEKLAPHAAQWERDNIFPKVAYDEMGRLGLLGINVAEKWGGSGADHVALALAMEEVAAGCAAVATVMSGHNTVGNAPIENFGTEAQKEQYLPTMATGKLLSCFCLTEPHCGSDAAVLKTRAELKGDKYVLNGTKQFVTSGSNADVALIFAKTDPEAGKNGISAFIVPTDSPGYNVVRIEKKLGLKISDTCQVALEDLEVPVEHRLGEEGQGLKIALSNLEAGRVGIGALGVGIARAALEVALAYAKERETFGKQIIKHQAVSFRLARMAMQVETARQMVLHAAVLRDAGRPCIKEASMAKLHASEIAESVCSNAIQIHGGYGYLNDFPVERFYRDARICQIYEGTTDIQCLVISRELEKESG